MPRPRGSRRRGDGGLFGGDGSLARQLLIAFLAVAVPAALVLGAVTLHSLASLARVSHQLTEITVSLSATRDLQLALTQMESPLNAYLLSGNRQYRDEFGGLTRIVNHKLASCGSSPCHEPARTPAQMATVLRPAIERFTAQGEAIFDAAHGHPGLTFRTLQGAHDELAGIRQKLHRMSLALLVRVEELGQQSEAVSRRASILGSSLTAAIVLIASAVAMVMAQRIAHPLRELLLGTRRVMAGDWNYRVAIAGTREINELATSFNAMVEELERSRERLEEYSRTLEARVRDRTEELKRKEAELMQSEKLASLGLLAAGVAHELNNPLTSIVMNANLLMEEVGDGSALYKDLRSIDADAGRCRRIIDDLRTFARRRDLQRAVSRVETAVDQALWSAGHELEGRRIRVERKLAADLPDVVWDPDRMVQVLTNLFVNAAQAMEPGGVLSVRANRDDGWLRIDVQDTGPGIAIEDRTRIFDPFFTTKPDGTGLGLSISHGIVNEHGGRIEVESQSAGEGPSGTRVTILLPLVGRST